MEVTNLNLNSNTTQLTESAIMSVVMAALFVIGMSYLPILIFVFPVPFIVIGIKNNLKSAWGSLIVGALLTMFAMDIVTAFSICAVAGIIGTSLVVLEKKDYSTSAMLGMTTIATLCTIMAILFISSTVTGFNYANAFKDTVELSTSYINASLDMPEMQNIPNTSPEEIKLVTKELKENFDEVMKRTIMLLPFSIIILSFLMTYLSYWASIVTLRKMNIKKREIPKIERFRLPEHILVGVLVILTATVLVSYIKIVHYQALVYNLGMIFSTLLAIQGYAVVAYKLKRSKIPKVLRFIISIFLILNGYMLTVCGAMDTIFDFRKIKKVENGD